jgi:glycosyltransferase involved in cell wall biosynthesis
MSEIQGGEGTELTRTIVLAHSSSTNSLGRALSMAMVAERLGPTTVLAYDDGPLWAGASQFISKIQVRDSSNFVEYLNSWLREGGRQVVWVSKGIDPLPRLFKAATRLTEPGLVILDIDDDDQGLAYAFRQNKWTNRLVLHRGRRMHPARIKNAQDYFSTRANAITFSSEALRSATSFKTAGNWARIPHVRTDMQNGASKPLSDCVEIGFLGTIRPHKGGKMLNDLLSIRPEFRLSVFEGSGMRADPIVQSQIRELPPNMPLGDAYSSIHAAVILIDMQMQGAAVQLPAKLVDAFNAGVPVVATDTDAIREFAPNNSAVLVPGDVTAEDLAKAVELALVSGAGPRGREVYKTYFTPTASSQVLARLICSFEGGGTI